MHKELPIKKKCPITSKEETVYLCETPIPNLYLCNTCDNSNGSPACQRCTAEEAKKANQ